LCVVVNDQRIVLGILRAEQLSGPDDQRAEDAMRPGPSTYRPNVEIGEMADRMTKHDLDAVPITSSDGKLMGVLHREDALREAHGRHDS
jgi:predicted transcriptional regulator